MTLLAIKQIVLKKATSGQTEAQHSKIWVKALFGRGIFLSTQLIAFLFIYFFGSGQAFSESTNPDHPHCNELARYACAPGKYHDGTGEVRSDSEIQAEANAIAAQAKTFLKAKFTEELKKTSSGHFKTLALAGFGLAHADHCQIPDSGISKSLPEQCLNDVVEQLSKVAANLTIPELSSVLEHMETGEFEQISFILENKIFQRVVGALHEDMKGKIIKTQQYAEIRDIVFPNVQRLLIERIEKLKIPEKQKIFMQEKINSVEFNSEPCLHLGNKSKKGSDTPQIAAALLVPNAVYDSSSHTFKVCNGLLVRSTSLFDKVFALAHELVHPIDPCNLVRGPADLPFKYSDTLDIGKMQTEYPMTHVLKCLRDSRSVGAINQAMQYPAAAPANGYTKKLRPGGSATDKRGSGPYAKYEAPSFCENDQIKEAMCDWLATEILSIYPFESQSKEKLTAKQYREGYANAFRTMCRNSDRNSIEFKVHPKAKDRINKIILVHPNIRRNMGCAEDPPKGSAYCHSDKALEPIASSLPKGGGGGLGEYPSSPHPYPYPYPYPSPASAPLPEEKPLPLGQPSQGTRASP